MGKRVTSCKRGKILGVRIVRVDKRIASVTWE